MNSQTNFRPYERRFVIKCECGFEIPVIPDVKAVGNTIDAHVEEHVKIQTDPAKGEIAGKRVHDYLFKKLFEKISQTGTE